MPKPDFKTYMQSGGKTCPSCLTTEYLALTSDDDNSTFGAGNDMSYYVPMECKVCGFWWTDKYVLTECIEETKNG